MEFINVTVPQDQIWMIVVGFFIAFLLAFGIGANDVANSFGTSVGSKVLTLRQAFILASIFETLGAVLLGAKVSDTIRKGIIDLTPYQNNTKLLMLGNVASLSGSCVWLIAATLLRLPVSATHSIVGSTVGFALVIHGSNGIHWVKLATIITSWFISPILAGIVSIMLFWTCKKFILSKHQPLEPGLRFLPIFYAMTIVVNIFSVFYEGPEMLRFNLIPLWGTFIISFGAGTIGGIIIYFFIVPWQRKKIQEEVSRVSVVSTLLNMNDSEETGGSTNTTSIKMPKESIKKHHKFDENTEQSDTSSTPTHLRQGRSTVTDAPEAARLFSFLQILTAIFGSFAHGGNDVSNSIGPLVSLWLIGTTGYISQETSTPILILLYGGFGISVGLVVLGRKVIKTIGEDLAKVTPSSGFCIEIGSALTVLVASNIGLPISTTHCKVGSVVFVGRYRARENVDWSIFRNIVLAWLVTLPICGGVSAAIMAGLRILV
ncbi:hypothetical protein HELRODRAFT_190726 [Helobdella robusta]|uniref:Phosphate transporter n=1 Tax=Helobdella robusta TaxID=6412 RepID=T1FS88_HELRO|nr:hypothetical protein HELRODRAFT_190726 [Helobdella robusta]ESO09139.1 hypothetical protein HELRODRAFT_190726 [Helobdella robusta]